MAVKRRGRGEDSVYFDQANGYWVGSVSLGFSADVKRRRRTVRGRTKTEVRDKLRDLREEIAVGVRSPASYSVRQAVDDWLTWAHVDLDGQPDASPPVPPSVAVWRSVRQNGDTKTRKSRRTLALPQASVDALRAHRNVQAADQLAAGGAWQDHGLVFSSRIGTLLDAANIRLQVPATT